MLDCFEVLENECWCESNHKSSSVDAGIGCHGIYACLMLVDLGKN
jgi:hypothetical protein